MGFDSSIGIRGEEADQAVQNRGVTGGWAGWAIAHPDFGRIVMRRR